MSGEAVFAIDLGGTNCRGALVTPGGEVGDIVRMPTLIDEGCDPFLHRLIDFCNDSIYAGRNRGVRVRAVAMGVPGVIAADGTVTISPNLLPLNGLPLAARLRQALSLPVSLVNDANAIAWGEALFGAGRKFPSFVVITLGTGVGGGLVLNGCLWEGADGSAGELGHFTVEPQGRPCGCGNRGCLEQYASASGVILNAREFLAAGKDSTLAELPLPELTSHTIALAARAGDQVAAAAFHEAGRRLGQALAGVVNLLNPDGVVITGGASESIDLLRPALTEELALRTFTVPVRRLQIVRGTLGDIAGILGAARLAYDRLNDSAP